MAEYVFAGAPAAVIGREFMASNRVELSMVKKRWTRGDFDVMDGNGNIKFKVMHYTFSMHSRRQLLDAAGTPLINLRAKMRKKKSFKSWLMGNKHYMVTVYPNVDYAFITTLISVLDAINSKRNSSGGGGGGAVSG